VTSESWFRRLLRLLPADFRSDYGSEMQRVFQEQRRAVRSRGRAGIIRLWWQTAADLLAIGPHEHLAQVRQDLRFAFRSIRRSAAFVAVAILTLALGIGANAAVFSVVHAVWLRPLPYYDPDRLVAVWNRWDGSATATLSDPEYLDYADRSRSMTIAASASAAVNIGAHGGDPERVAAAFVTANTFDVLGAPPALGRSFRLEEEMNSGSPVAILSDGLWRRHFGADPGVVGRTIAINGVSTEVIGVSHAGVVVPFELGAATAVDVLLPLRLDRAAPRNRRGGHYLMAFGRLTPGASLAAASAEMDGIVADLIRAYPEEHDQGNFGIVVRSLREDRLGDSGPVLLVLLGAVSLVLLLACANVANLMLARGESRRRELAVRTALGVSRFRIVRQLLTESCALSVAGAAAGLGVAWFCQRAVVTLGTSALPRLADVRMSAPVLLFTTALAICTGVLFGLVPALTISRTSADEGLKNGGRGGTERARLRHALVVCQAAVAVVLLVAAGLLVKSFMRLTSVPSGVNAAHVLTTRVSLPAARYPDREAVTAFFDRLLSRVRALPGVRAAGAASGLPLAVASGDWSFDIEGRAKVGGRYPGAADWFVVTPGYFEALGIPLRRGRLPAALDTSAATPVVFINDATARTLFLHEDPIGKRIRLTRTTGAEQPWRTIVGIVGDVRHRRLDAPPRTEIFIPHEQFLHFSAGVQARAMSLVVKTEQPPTTIVSSVRAALRALDPDVPAAQVRDMSTVVAQSVADRRLHVVVIGAFGGLALTLAAIGLYGMMAYTVTQRTREMGVRIAMGATRGAVLLLVVGHGLRLVAGGVVAGLAAALW